MCAKEPAAKEREVQESCSKESCAALRICFIYAEASSSGALRERLECGRDLPLTDTDSCEQFSVAIERCHKTTDYRLLTRRNGSVLVMNSALHSAQRGNSDEHGGFVRAIFLSKRE